MAIPLAEKRTYSHTDHGLERHDPWHWLRDIDDPKVKAYLNAENEYTQSQMLTTVEFQKKIFEELKARIKEDDVSATEKEDEYDYFDKTIKGEEYSVFCRRKRDGNAKVEILLDCNELAEGKDFLELGVCEVSPDHKLLAYSLDEEGDEKFTIFVKNIATGELLQDTIINTHYSLEWTNDCKSFFYTELDCHLRPKFAKQHTLGQPASEDRLVYQEEDSRFFVSIDKSDGFRFIYVASEGNNMSEWHYLDAQTGLGPLSIIEPRSENHEYHVSDHVSDHGDFFYIRTDLDAPDYKIVQTNIAKPTRDNWSDFIPYSEGTLVESFSTYQNFIAVINRIKGQNNLLVFDMRTGKNHTVELPQNTCEISFGGGREYETNLLRFSVSSMAVPGTLYDYNMETKERDLVKTQEIPDPKFDASNYVSRKIFAKSADGVMVPISLMHHKDTAIDGSAPLILYGYGSYGMSMDAVFSRARISYADRGIVFAIAHIRGGMELGKKWYLDGKLLQKKNTFHDFLACADTLIAKKYTSSGSILGMGGSAGGMLMGAVANMRPSLFAGIVAQVPFVDVLTTMLDETLPLTTSEYNEWGNPNDKNFYDYIESYSPYDNVKAQDYPPMLVECGLNDSRVTYWEPAKWVAKLRDMKTDKNEVLLKTNMDSGHGGASGRYDDLKEAAFEMAFVCKVLKRM